MQDVINEKPITLEELKAQRKKLDKRIKEMRERELEDRKNNTSKPVPKFKIGDIVYIRHRKAKYTVTKVDITWNDLLNKWRVEYAIQPTLNHLCCECAYEYELMSEEEYLEYNPLTMEVSRVSIGDYFYTLPKTVTVPIRTEDGTDLKTDVIYQALILELLGCQKEKKNKKECKND